MQFSKFLRSATATAILALPSLAAAGGEKVLFTTSLNPCAGSTNDGFTATLFNVYFTPNNNTITYNINAAVTIHSYVNATIELLAYGYALKTEFLDPCANPELASLCPLEPGNIPLNSNSPVPGAANLIPGIAYTFPDLDGLVKARITNASSGVEIACFEAQLTNGQTVDQTAVKWVTAIIAGIALVTSAIMSGLGHSNTAAHVAANALSLFGFFQAQAIFGMTAVPFPPMAQSWVQNFAWSMGIVNIPFMQTVLTWYQRATGGTPSTILSTLSTYSVQVQKRSLEAADELVKRGAELVGREPYLPSSVTSELLKRGASLVARDDATGPTQSVVSGIERLGFRDGIEPTNVFLTGLGIFVAFIVATAIFVALAKALCELAAKNNWIKGDQFLDFRNGWKVILKGILFRIVLIGYAQMAILCLWELTVRDSAAEVVTAIFYFVAMTLALGWAAIKVWRLAKRSVHMHKNPAYILYSDPAALNKWGFLYVQYRATAYYWIFPQLAYILLKALFVAFGQNNGAVGGNNGVAQAIGLLIIEIAWLIGICIVRPWMDKKTNSFNIAISVVNFLSSICLLIFSDVFQQPELATGVTGVVFALMNMIFSAVLLIMVLLASGYAIFSKNPDTRYQPMRDDRGSFIKSQTNLNTELDALGATARGNNMAMKRDLDEDASSFAESKGGYTGSTAHVNSHGFPDRSNTASPAPHGNSYYGGNPVRYQDNYDFDRSGTPSSGFRNQGGSQWQRGAGYDH